MLYCHLVYVFYLLYSSYSSPVYAAAIVGEAGGGLRFNTGAQESLFTGDVLVGPNNVSVLGLSTKYSSLSDSIINVRAYGARGDGESDDTAAFLSSVAAVVAQNRSTLYIPSGEYVVSSSLVFNSATVIRISVRGDGLTSIIHWPGAHSLFVFGGTTSSDLTIRDVWINSLNQSKPVTSWAIHLQSPSRSIIDHVHITAQTVSVMGGGIYIAGSAGYMVLRSLLIQYFAGPAIQVDSASQLLVEGGRLQGQGSTYAGAHGIHVKGVSTVHISDVMFFFTYYGVYLQGGPSSSSNIFITQSTFKGNVRGLVIEDSSTTTLTGSNFLGCYHEAILMGAAVNSTLVMYGGSMRDAGSPSCPTPATSCNGLRALGGTFVMNGVLIKGNPGRGVQTTDTSMRGFNIQGCQFIGNNMAMSLTGANYMAGNNVCLNAQTTSVYGGTPDILLFNQGC